MGKALSSRVDGVANNLRTLRDDCVVENLRFVVGASTHHIKHRASPMEAHIDRDTGLETCVGEGPVNKLAIAHDYVAGSADERDGSLDALAT